MAPVPERTVLIPVRREASLLLASPGTERSLAPTRVLDGLLAVRVLAAVTAP